MSAPRSIAPGSTIGIFGGGQLGRMTALAARSMGYRLHFLDPDADCAAAPVADRVVAARFDDVDGAREFGRHCDVLTLEIEQIAPDAMAAASTDAPLRPSAETVRMIQDRASQKAWLRDAGFPVGDYRDVRDEGDLRAAVRDFGEVFVKATHGGYDGRSQARIQAEREVAAAWIDLGERHCVAERALQLAGELSVLVARRPAGDVVVYPAALNHHERQILSWSVIPAPLSPKITDSARDLAQSIAGKLQLEGILAIEMFLTVDGRIFVNELAPRPHNSYHASERACVTSQFEQITRAVCNLPLGSADVVRPAAIVNIFGDAWARGSPDFAAALDDTSVRLHLYGKRGPRPGRKMGHLSAVGGSSLGALDAARAAARRIGVETGDFPASLQPFSGSK